MEASAPPVAGGAQASAAYYPPALTSTAPVISLSFDATSYPPPPNGALVLHGQAAATTADSSEDSDSDSDSGPPKDVGDVDPSKCKVSGPGFSGAGCAAPVQLYLHAYDAWGRRLRQGGDEVVVRISPASSSMVLDAPIEVEVVDNQNGTYTCTYTAPVKGNYFLAVEVNYLPIAGSPFPVFFSNPVDPAEAAAAATQAAAAAATAGGISATTGTSMTLDPAVVAMAQAAKQAVAGASAQTDVAMRTVYISNLSPVVAQEQYRQLFSIPGKIKDIKMAGEGGSAMLIIEYSSSTDADEAVKMGGMVVGDRPVVVQNGMTYQQAQGINVVTGPAAVLGAVSSIMPPGVLLPGAPAVPVLPTLAPGATSSDPFIAMQQMMQMQEMQRMQSQMAQTQQLQQQVAQMRAEARATKTAGRNPDEDRAKAAEAAMERLNRKLGASAPPDGVVAKRRSRSRSSSDSSRSRDRGRGRRDRSRDRRHSRSRSRDRRERDRRDRERRDRERREQERRDRERRDRDRRESERREMERRDRERRDRDKDRERDRKERDRKERDSSRDKTTRRRSRSRTPDRNQKEKQRKEDDLKTKNDAKSQVEVECNGAGAVDNKDVKSEVDISPPKDSKSEPRDRSQEHSIDRERSKRKDKDKDDKKKEKKERKEKRKEKKSKHDKDDAPDDLEEAS